MRILLIADVHANLPALEAVLSEAKTIDKIICLGDLSGYLPYVNEVIESISSLNNLVCIKGNHDYVLINEDESTGSMSADYAISLQRKIIKDKNKTYLEGLPEHSEIIIDGQRYFLFHGSPSEPLNGREKFLEKNNLPAGIYFFGHTHKSVFKENSNNGWMAINPGSCGFPRDGDNRASYAVFDSTNKKVFFNRVIYSISTVIEQCKNTGFPEKIWRSLEAGKWISDKTEGGVE